jgi:secondary thiamine-phosphate synthase enzyme
MLGRNKGGSFQSGLTLHQISDSLTIYSDGLYYTEVLTDRINRVLAHHAIEAGLVNLVLRHTTSALILLEHEAGVLLDMQETLERLVPTEGTFYHHLRDVDKNGRAHVLSGLFNQSITLAVQSARLQLGTYQEVLFVDFQSTPAARSMLITTLQGGSA